ncbi:MAG: glycosyltransferase [Terrimicrobiaceae bacterium]|nr:glycosyltransferase [Terrimicrobiaceae bacterium]
MTQRLRIAATGFVEEGAGSIASANTILLREWLAAGCEVDFFSKATFVDPRGALGAAKGFRFFDVRNAWADQLRRSAERVPLVGLLASRIDTTTYHRALCAAIAREHRQRPYDVCLWLGDYSRGRIAGLPTVSFAQGPPGTDARAMIRHFELIRTIAGLRRAIPLLVLARLRLSLGLPEFERTDRILVGSSQSRNTLVEQFGVAAARVGCLPYPIEPERFPVADGPRGEFTAIWLGRMVPRKRLDVFLDGAAQAISEGCDLRLMLVGSPGYIPQQAQWIEQFPFPDRLEWTRSMPRSEVPRLFARGHVLVQPSEEEDFGSSVAEAQMSGLPVIVGPTNGNRDYAGPNDVVLPNASPSTLAAALKKMAAEWNSRWLQENRRHAEAIFDPPRVAGRFLDEIRTVVSR